MKSPIQKLAELISDKDPVPNKLTLAMGDLVRRARDEAGLNQSQLAHKIYRRQATISAIETGTSEVSAPTLVLLAAALKKPISYFFPPYAVLKIRPEDLDPEELELLIQFRRLSPTDARRIIAQIRALADLEDKEDVAEIDQAAKKAIRAMKSRSSRRAPG